MQTFHCPRWPRCNCPDGTVALDCPCLNRHQRRMDEIVEQHKRQATSAMPIYYAGIAVVIFTILWIGLNKLEAMLKLAAV